MLYALADWPTWLILALCTALFSAIMFGTRWATRRIKSSQRQKELVTLASSMNGPTGATLAFLVGFAVSITWGTISAAQSSVEKVAAQAQEISWLSDRLDDRGAAEALNRDLRLYLATVATEDKATLAQQYFNEMPSFKYLDALEADLRRIAATDSKTNPQSSKLVSGGAELVTAQAELNAIARRDLPPVFIQLLILTGALSAATVGIVAARTRRPYLIAGWALVTAMGITVVLTLYDPFSGSVTVNFQPLLDAAERLHKP